MPLPPIISPPPFPRRRRINRIAVALAAVVAAVTLPATFKYQSHRIEPPEKRQWRMTDLHGMTNTKAVERFGPPLKSRDYSLSDGSFLGPRVGLKHYVPANTPEYAEKLKAAEVSWTFPEYSTIREMIWQLPDSYLTIWLHEPRAEIDLSGDGQIVLPSTANGEWVALDNYRVGKDLVKSPPTGP